MAAGIILYNIFKIPFDKRKHIESLENTAQIFVIGGAKRYKRRAIRMRYYSTYNVYCICHYVTISVKIKFYFKFYLKSVHFITVQHKLLRAFQTDMHNKLHKLNTAQ
jgi:hypothetical protein